MCAMKFGERIRVLYHAKRRNGMTLHSSEMLGDLLVPYIMTFIVVSKF